MNNITGKVKDICSNCEYFDSKDYECIFRAGTYLEGDTNITCNQFNEYIEED